MKRICSRLLAYLLSALLLLGSAPVTAWAEEPAAEAPAITETSAPTDTPSPTDTPKPTETPSPTDTPAPTEAADEPTATPPEEAPEATETPAEEPTLTPDPALPSELPSETPEPTLTPEPTFTPEPTPVPVLEGFELLFDESGVTVARYVGGGEHAAVPAFVGDLPVKAIATGAFSDLETLASVEVAEGVTALQSGAFNNCPLLASITLPASLTDIAEDAIISCPLAVVTAPEGSPAADFGARYAAALPTPEPVSDLMMDGLTIADFGELFDVDINTTQMRLHPTEDESINLFAVITPAIGSPVLSYNAPQLRWDFWVYDNSGVQTDDIFAYLWTEGGQEEIRVNLNQTCPTGAYTLRVSAILDDTTNYTQAYDFNVLPAPTMDFDEALTITDGSGAGIPSLMYVGDGTTGYSGRVQVKDGSGLDRCVFDNVYFDNWNVINLGWNNDAIDLNPHDAGSDTLHVRVRGYFGKYNEVYFEKAFPIDVADVDFERPTLTLKNALSGNKLVVGDETGGALTPFSLTYTVEGGEHAADFRANVKLKAQTFYGEERLISDGGDTYHFTHPGLYPVALVATYLNTTVSYNFFVQVLKPGGADPDATFETYFNMSSNPDGDQGGLYYVPSLANSVRVAGFDLVKGVPFAASDVSYAITFLGNDVDGEPSGGVPCADVTLGSGDAWGWNYVITALPGSQAGAGPAFSYYKLTATVSQEGEADQVYNTDFAVNMQSLDIADNLPDRTLTLTGTRFQLDYRADKQYTLPLPGIQLGGKTLPDNIWLKLYNIERNGNQSEWGFLLDSDNDQKRRDILQGTPALAQFEWERPESLKMCYVIDYGNLRWEAPFRYDIGVSEHDASQLFNVDAQERTVFLGGQADPYAWGGHFYMDKAYHITEYNVDVVSTPVGGSARLDVYNNCNDSQTDIGYSFAPSKVGTYRFKLWVDVDEDGDELTPPTRYDHVFELTVVATPTNLLKAITLKDPSAMTVMVGDRFPLPEINENPSAFDAYGWDQNLSIWGDGALQDSGNRDEHGSASDNEFWMDTPGRYKMVRELTIGANYYLRAFITLTVTNEAHEVVCTDISASMDSWGWDDAYTVMPKGNAENDLFMVYVNNTQLGDDVTEEWSLNINDASVGQFTNYKFVDRIKGDNDRPSEAKLVGCFPIKSGAVTFSIVYDAYEGTGEGRVHIYHGETPEKTVRIVDTLATGDFRLVGTPVTYTTDASGFVHIDAWKAVSDDLTLTDDAVHNDFYVIDDPDGTAQVTIVNSAGEEDREHSTGCNIQFDPTKPGAYLVGQHTWVSLPDTDLWADTAFRVVVGSGASTALTLHENSIDLSTVNLYDGDPNVSEKYYWVDGAVGETLNWKLTRKSGTSVDLVIVNSEDKWGTTCTRVLNSALDNNGNLVHIASLNKAGLSTFELTATLTTLGGKTLTAKKTFSVNVVEQENYAATLTAPTREFTAEVGQTVEIPQPTITWPAGSGTFTFQRNWFWSKDETLGGYTYNESDSVRNVVLCPTEAGLYTVTFMVVRGATHTELVYSLVVNEPGETAPEPEPQMHAINYTQKGAEFYDTDGDGIIEITCPLDGGVGAWSTVAEFSLWGMSLAQMEGLTFSVESPTTPSVVQMYCSKLIGDTAVIFARYDKAIGFPCTYTVSALIDHVDYNKRLQVTFLPPRVPQVLTGLDSLTLSVGMTYQLDMDGLSGALGQPVTAFSCDYDGKTPTDKRLTVSASGLITVTGQVENAVVYAETDDPANLAGIRVTVKGAAVTLVADQAALTFTSIAGNQPLTLTAKDGEGNKVPATIAISGNPAVCTCELSSTDGFDYTYTVTPVGYGTANLVFKVQGATLTVPVTVKQALTGVSLAAPERIFAGTSGAVTATFTPADATERALTWDTQFVDGSDTAGFNNAWIVINNGVITVSKALDRAIQIEAVARWTVGGEDKTAVSDPITLVPLATGIDLVPAGDGLTLIGTQYVYDLSSYDPSSDFGFEVRYTPASLAEFGCAPQIQWVSSASAVAAVNNNGIITPLKPGTTNITATALDGSKKTKTVTLVVRKYVASMTLACATQPKLVAGSGATLKFTANCLPLDATLKTVTWQSSDPTLLSVNPTTGVATAVKGAAVTEVKEVTITATATDGSGISGSLPVNVVPMASTVTIISIGDVPVTTPATPIDLDMQAYKATDGNIAPLALAGATNPYDDYPLLWTSSNPAAASVSYDESGNASLTLRKVANNIKLTATSQSNKGAKSTVLINVTNSDLSEVVPAKVTVTGASTLTVSSTALYQAVVEPAAATNKAVAWVLCDSTGGDTTDYTGIATLSPAGLLKAIAPSGATLPTDVYVKAITVTNGVASDPFHVRLYNKTTSVTLTGSEDSLIPGQEAHFIDIGASPSIPLTLTAAVAPIDARPAVAFSTSNNKVLTVTPSETDPCKAVVSAAGVGTAKIIATAMDGSGRKAEYTVTVGVVTSTLHLNGVETVMVSGNKQALMVNREPALVTNPKLVWTSSDPKVATVSSTGLVTAKTVQQTTQVTITVAAADRPGLSDIVIIDVRPRTTGVTLLDSEGNPLTSRSTLTLTLYKSALETTQLAAVCAPYSGAAPLTGALQKVRYASSNPDVAVVTTEGGLVDAVAAGTAKITATATDGSNKSATVTVKVICKPGDLLVTGPSGAAIGKSVPLSATILPTGTLPEAINWSITEGGTLASISKAGVLSIKKGVAAGERIIVKAALASDATIDGLMEIFTRTPVTSVPTNYGTGKGTVKAPLYQGSLQISATCLPTGALQQLAYSSSNPKVATVDSDGLVTFRTTGTASITVAARDGSNVKTVISLTVTK